MPDTRHCDAASNGVGKSTIARNIAHHAVLHGHTALFTSAGQLLGDLAAIDSASALRRRLSHYAAPALLVIDEVVFYLLYDKICREDILAHAYALSRANAGAPGVDGKTFEQIEAAGVEAWLAGLREDLVSKSEIEGLGLGNLLQSAARAGTGGRASHLARRGV